VQFCNTEVLLITEIINLKTKNFEEIYLHGYRDFESFIISCSVVDQLLTFTISNQTTFKFKQAHFEVLNLENNEANLVKDVRLKELTVTITDPQTKLSAFKINSSLYFNRC
jgi:hypothetical protein